MLERVVEQQQALCAVLLDSQSRVVRSLLPDGAEWSVIEELMVILKPFALATTGVDIWYDQYCVSPNSQVLL